MKATTYTNVIKGVQATPPMVELNLSQDEAVLLRDLVLKVALSRRPDFVQFRDLSDSAYTTLGAAISALHTDLRRALQVPNVDAPHGGLTTRDLNAHARDA